MNFWMPLWPRRRILVPVAAAGAAVGATVAAGAGALVAVWSCHRGGRGGRRCRGGGSGGFRRRRRDGRRRDRCCCRGGAAGAEHEAQHHDQSQHDHAKTRCTHVFDTLLFLFLSTVVLDVPRNRIAGSLMCAGDHLLRATVWGVPTSHDREKAATPATIVCSRLRSWIENDDVCVLPDRNLALVQLEQSRRRRRTYSARRCQVFAKEPHRVAEGRDRRQSAAGQRHAALDQAHAVVRAVDNHRPPIVGQDRSDRQATRPRSCCRSQTQCARLSCSGRPGSPAGD